MISSFPIVLILRLLRELGVVALFKPYVLLSLFAPKPKMSSLPATVPSILQRSFWACSALRLLLCSLLLTGSSALSSKQRVLHDTAGCNTSGNEAMSDNAGPWNDEFGELVQNYLDQFHVPSVAIAVVENKSISSTV
jgi:hypothetical protein